MIFRQLDARLQLKHADFAQARFAACGFHQFSTDTSALQERADGQLADVECIVLLVEKQTADQITRAVGEQQPPLSALALIDFGVSLRADDGGSMRGPM